MIVQIAGLDSTNKSSDDLAFNQEILHFIHQYFSFTFEQLHNYTKEKQSKGNNASEFQFSISWPTTNKFLIFK